jgi:hypothetical protein
VRHAIDYTLVDRASTRGFQTVWHYLAHVGSWSDVVVVGLAVFGTIRGAFGAAWWAWVPLVVLSALPHKEARYLVPAMPFVAMLAAVGFWALTRPSADDAPLRRPVRAQSLAMVISLALSGVYAVSRFDLVRTDSAVALARETAASPAVTGVGVEQLWRWGGRVYLGSLSTLLELDGQLAQPGDLARIASEPSLSVIALRVETCARLDCERTLRESGHTERASIAARTAGYRVFGR